MRLRVSLSLAAGALAVTLAFAQESDSVKEKPIEIRKADAVDKSQPDETPTPAKKKKSSPTPSPTPKHKSHPTPSETPEADQTPAKKSAKVKAKAKKESADSEDATPAKSPTPKKKKHGAKTKASPTPTPKKKKSDEAEQETPAKSPTPAKPAETPSPSPSVARNRTDARGQIPNLTVQQPAATPSAPPAPRPGVSGAPFPGEEAEQLTIEKSGYDRPRGFWARFFGAGGRRTTGSGVGYRYLTRSVRDAIDRAPADRRNPRWQMIVVHNSGSRQGNAKVFDYYHRHVRHMQNGLAYHFVIGNGTSTGNGEVEIGDRWRRQINGGHVHSDYLNNIALGICLVGDFNRDQPTRAQLDCCEELIRYLRQRCGKYDNFHFPVVKPHREANPPRWGTDCPGNVFPYSWFRRFRE